MPSVEINSFGWKFDGAGGDRRGRRHYSRFIRKAVRCPGYACNRQFFRGRSSTTEVEMFELPSVRRTGIWKKRTWSDLLRGGYEGYEIWADGDSCWPRYEQSDGVARLAIASITHDPYAARTTQEAIGLWSRRDPDMDQGRRSGQL